MPWAQPTIASAPKNERSVLDETDVRIRSIDVREPERDHKLMRSAVPPAHGREVLAGGRTAATEFRYQIDLRTQASRLILRAWMNSDDPAVPRRGLRSDRKSSRPACDSRTFAEAL